MDMWAQGGRGGVGRAGRLGPTCIHDTRETGNEWEAALQHRAPCLVLSDDLEDGMVGCEGGSRGGDICVHMADSAC